MATIFPRVPRPCPGTPRGDARAKKRNLVDSADLLITPSKTKGGPTHRIDEEAAAIKKQLEGAGATVEVK